MRYNNKAVQRELKQLGLDGISRPPKPIEINLDQDYCELSVQEPEALTTAAREDSSLPLSKAPVAVG